MSKKIKVANMSDFIEGEGLIVEVQDKSIALFKVGKEVHAIENFCPHQGAPLGNGALDEDVVTCPWHGWQFNVTTGESVMGAEGVEKYPLQVENKEIFILI